MCGGVCAAEEMARDMWKKFEKGGNGGSNTAQPQVRRGKCT